MTRNSFDSVIAVFERRPYWGPELQRQFGLTPIAVRECRTLADLLPMAAGFDKTLLLIELDSAAADCLTWFAGECRQLPRRWPMIVCGSPEVADLEWDIRQAGATEFVAGPIPGDQLARLCRRILGIQ